MRSLLVLTLLLCPALAHAEGEKIVLIDIFENTKTNDQTVLSIARVARGDVYTQELLERATTDLKSSGLFQEVTLFTSPAKDGVRLTIVAKDKHSWVIAPTFYTTPGNIGGGVGFGENNLFGRNKKLLLYGQIATADTFFFGVFLDPSLAGTPFYWRVDTWIRREKVTEFDSPDAFLGAPTPERQTTLHYYNAGILVGVNLMKALGLDMRLRAAKVFFRDTEWAEGADPATHPDPPMDPGLDGWDVTMEWRLIHDKRASWNGVTEGRLFQIAHERSLESMGSDWNYWLFTGKLQLYKRVFDTHNLVFKTWAGVGHELPFSAEFTSGGTNLRGYANRQFRGDFKVGTNLEYSLQLFWWKSFAFRGLVFWDSAYTSFLMSEGNEHRNYLAGQTDDQINRFRNGVGTGFRIYAKSIVLPLLGVDVGYGLEANTWNVYLAVGLTEF
jgi:outer membrane protein insertion porin family